MWCPTCTLESKPKVVEESSISPSAPSASVTNREAPVACEVPESNTNTAVGIPCAPTLRTFQNLDPNMYEERYDSDGLIGPHFDANIAEGAQIYGEEEINIVLTNKAIEVI